MADRPNVIITQVEETPISTPGTPTLEPAILGDLRLAVVKGDTSTTYNQSLGTTVSYPLLELLATPIVRFVDDRVLGKHETERVYTEWDILEDAQDMTSDLLEATDPIGFLEREEVGFTGAGPFVMASKPLIRDTIQLRDVIVTVTPADVEIDDIFDVTINGVKFSFTATAATVANVTLGLVTAINGGTEPVTATDNTTDLTLSPDVVTVPFTVVTATTNKTAGVDDQTLVLSETFFAEADDFTVDYDTGTITVVGSSSLATHLGSGAIKVSYSPRPAASVVVNLLFEDTFSTVPNQPVTFRLQPDDYVATTTSVKLLKDISFPNISNVSLNSEPQTFSNTALDSADVDITLNNGGVISGSISVSSAAGTVYEETKDWKVKDLTTGELTLLSDAGSAPADGGQIDKDDVSVVFVTYQAKFPGLPKILVTYTASRVARDETLLRLTTREDLEAIAGETVGWKSEIGPYNPLLFGMAVAQDVAGGNIVAGTPFRADNTSEVFELLSKNELYSLVPMTPDVSLASLVKGHVDTESLPVNGQERVLIFSPETRLERSVYPFGDLQDAVGVAFLDNVNGIVFDPNFTTSLTDSTLGDPRPGDFVEILGKQLKITGVSISGSDAAYFVDGASVAFPTAEDAASIPTVTGTPPGSFSETHAVAYRVIRKLQRTEIVDLAKGIRVGFDDRRSWMLLPDIVKLSFTSDISPASLGATILDLPGFIRGAHIAGLRTVTLANQAYTNFVLTGFTGARHTNEFFTRSEVDDLIEDGIDLAVVEGSSLRSLRSITTDVTTIGNAEQSIITTVDFGVKTLRGVLEQFLGVYNVTDNTLNLLRFAVQGVEASLRNSQSERTGPIVLRIDVVELKESDEFKDRVEMTLRFVISAPLNVIEVTVLF